MEQSLKPKPRRIRGTRLVLAASDAERELYEVVVADRTFVVLPGVFSPKYFHDTDFFARLITVQPGERFLEIGPGTGVISVLAALAGATEVVAVDINQAAVTNTIDNAQRHGVASRITVLHGDVYEPLAATDRFDTIFWNVPFHFVPEDYPLTDLDRAVFNPGYESTIRFVREAKQHLKPGGRLLIGFSTTLGSWWFVKQLLLVAGFHPRLLGEIWSVQTDPVKFQLFEARLKKGRRRPRGD